jgi:ribosomal protein S18 acetylase RimI-like enzyme
MMLAQIVIVDCENEELMQRCSDVLRGVGKLYYESSYTHYMVEHGGMWVALDEKDRVIGVLVTDRWLALDTREWNRSLAPDREISTYPISLYLVDLAVVPEERRRGVGTRIVQQAINSPDCEPGGRYFAVSRVPPRGPDHTSLGLLQRLGFVVVTVDSSYYQTAELWHCPDCGGDCECAGYLMSWTRCD